ncbi:MAG: helix-turn-helix transcriptional regulator [Acetobacteraceae bacterium]|nr:helix-turn-helix transcriptional regulator [Acetobacteraceae bacterium]
MLCRGEANVDRPLYILEICEQTGVSPRTVRKYCRECLGMGPHQYLWLRRMHQAHRALTLGQRRGASTTPSFFVSHFNAVE